jgi:hypothetical protein
MLRASLLANAEILPQARQGSYFFNRIGRFLPFTSISFWSSEAASLDENLPVFS